MQLGDTSLHLHVTSDPWHKCELNLNNVVVLKFHLIYHQFKLIGCPVNSDGTDLGKVVSHPLQAIRPITLLWGIFD